MATFDDRERFIPVTKSDLVEMLSKEEGLSDEGREKFKDFTKLLESLFHFEYHSKLETLKETYAPFDPDRDTVGGVKLTEQEQDDRLVQLAEVFGEACEGANFEKMSDEELNEAFEGWSPFGGINLKLDLQHYVEYSLYYRGETMEVREHRDIFDLFRGKWPKKKPFESKVYKRLAILAKVKDESATKKFDTDHVFVKLFKNVPALDLEMLFPTTKPGLKKLDMIQIVLPIVMGIAMLTFQTVTGYFNGVELKTQDALVEETSTQESMQGEGDARLAGAVLDEALVDKMLSENSLRVQRKVGKDQTPVDNDDRAAMLITLKRKAYIAVGAGIPDTLPADDGDESTPPDYGPVLNEFRATLILAQGLSGSTTADTINGYSAAKLVEEATAVVDGTKVLIANDFIKSFVRGVIAGGVIGLLALFGSWTMRAFFKYLQSKQKYTGVLAQNLFYLNLDNNSGVFNALIDMAEEEECKEAFFAAFFLNLHPDGNPKTGQPWTEESLDDYIENWISENVKQPKKKFEIKTAEGESQDYEETEDEDTVMVPVLVDFEIDDALDKLERLGLLTKGPNGELSMLGWDKALERVDYLWDNFFEYNTGDSDDAPNSEAAPQV